MNIFFFAASLYCLLYCVHCYMCPAFSEVVVCNIFWKASKVVVASDLVTAWSRGSICITGSFTM